MPNAFAMPSAFIARNKNLTNKSIDSVLMQFQCANNKDTGKDILSSYIPSF